MASCSLSLPVAGCGYGKDVTFPVCVDVAAGFAAG